MYNNIILAVCYGNNELQMIRACSTFVFNNIRPIIQLKLYAYPYFFGELFISVESIMSTFGKNIIFSSFHVWSLHISPTVDVCVSYTGKM